MARARSLTFLARLVFTTLPLVAIAACGEDLPSFPPTPRDLGIECISTMPPPSDAGRPTDAGRPSDGGGLPPADGGGAGGGGGPTASGCDTGEVCLQGHCYEGCGGDGDCTASEQCTGGVCVTRTMPRVDMGMPDLGPPNLCAGVTCTDPLLPACHPRTGTCVECGTSDDCGLAAPVCDVAFGVCRSFVAAQCAPCKLDRDCTGAIGTFDTRCLARDNPLERVCVAVCASDGSCPQGTTCNGDSRCLPLIGTCTTFFAASQARACTIDENCAPLGSTTSDFLFPGSCRASACAAPCGMTGAATECPSAAQTCDGTFCTP